MKMLAEGLFFCLTATANAAPLHLSDQKLDEVSAGALMSGVIDFQRAPVQPNVGTHFVDPDLLASMGLSGLVELALAANFGNMSKADAEKALTGSQLHIIFGQSDFFLNGADVAPMLGRTSALAAPGELSSASAASGSSFAVSRTVTRTISTNGSTTTTTSSTATAR